MTFGPSPRSDDIVVDGSVGTGVFTKKILVGPSFSVVSTTEYVLPFMTVSKPENVNPLLVTSMALAVPMTVTRRRIVLRMLLIEDVSRIVKLDRILWGWMSGEIDFDVLDEKLLKDMWCTLYRSIEWGEVFR